MRGALRCSHAETPHARPRGLRYRVWAEWSESSNDNTHVGVSGARLVFAVAHIVADTDDNTVGASALGTRRGLIFVAAPLDPEMREH